MLVNIDRCRWRDARVVPNANAKAPMTTAVTKTKWIHSKIVQTQMLCLRRGKANKLNNLFT